MGEKKQKTLLSLALRLAATRRALACFREGILRRLLGIGAVLCVLLAGAAEAALVRTETLVLTANGGFTPQKLPRRAFVPIEFKGEANLRAVDGGVPAPLLRAAIDFDRDGRVSAGGLPACDPAAIEAATVAAARQICRRAIVGDGHIGVLVPRPGGPPLRIDSGLAIFNGPREGGHLTAILHARLPAPAAQGLTIVVPIRRRRGEFRYRAIVEVPPIAAGAGALTHLDVRLGRRYRFRGKARSYVSARCRDGVLRTHGRFLFDDPEATVIDGSVERFCAARR